MSNAEEKCWAESARLEPMDLQTEEGSWSVRRLCDAVLARCVLSMRSQVTGTVCTCISFSGHVLPSLSQPGSCSANGLT